MTIHLKGFEANQTLENLRVGIYKEGGRQIGQFSVKITIITHQVTVLCQQLKQMKTGNVTIKVNAKVLESMEGSKIRLKLGDKTLITTDFK